MGTFNLPDLGEGLAEAEIIQWHVAVGDNVRVDQPMVSVETAKAVVEVPAPFSGVVTLLHGRAGDIVATGSPLIDFDSGTVVGSMATASQEELPPQAAYRIARANGNGRARAVPAARALARTLCIDLADIEGSGSGGLIGIEDVLRFVERKDKACGGRVEGGSGQEPLRGMRRAMAQSMALSRDEVAQSTVCDDADIQAWHAPGEYMMRLMRSLVHAWREEPALNAWFDAKAMTRTLRDSIDLAVAVDTPNGLIVPVVRGIEKLGAAELKRALAAQKQAAHERRVAPEELRNFTLMLSNFGTLAGRYGVPRVVPPAVAILGAGKVRDAAVVVEGRIAAHRMMPLSLSFDHRCITGGEACRFLAAIIADLEQPE
ncbi:MAG TPA: dihydrolipoamide acetyltransferase family protein [Steroidobacteraceae bacterium]